MAFVDEWKGKITHHSTICPFKDNKNECSLSMAGMTCSVCIQLGHHEEAHAYIEKKEEIEKHWRWFRKWFDAHVEGQDVYMCEGTLNAWAVIKATLDDILKIAPASEEQKDAVSVIKLQVINEIFDELGLKIEGKIEGVNFN